MKPFVSRFWPSATFLVAAVSCSLAMAQTPLPSEVTLLRSVPFPIIVNGKTVGETVVEAGETVKLLERTGDQLRVSHNNFVALIPEYFTDLERRLTPPAEIRKPKIQNLSPPPDAPTPPPAPPESPAVSTPPPLDPPKLPASFDMKALAVARSLGSALLWASDQVKPAYVTIVVNDKTVISGVVIDSDGLVLTSLAALKGNAQPAVRIRGRSSQTHPSKLIASDRASGIALLKINGDNFSVAKLGNSDALRTCDWVMTLGATKSKTASINHGIISGLNRSSTVSKIPLIQTNAFTHLGDLGGPLINLDGEVVGTIVQSAAVGSSPVRAGYIAHTLVVPSSYIARLLQQMKASAK